MPNYIDRDKIMLAGVPVSRDEDGECYVLLSDVRRAIMQVPVIDTLKIRCGRWEQGDYYDMGDVCSLCGYDSCCELCRFKFCPSCGAKMDGDEE